MAKQAWRNLVGLLLMAVLLGSGMAKAESSLLPEPWDNLQGVKVCIPSYQSFLWASVKEPPEGFKEKSKSVGNDLVDLVSLRLQRNGVPFEVKDFCPSRPTLNWYAGTTGPIGAGYRGGIVTVEVSTTVYDAEGKAYPWRVDIYSDSSSFVLGPYYSKDATELLRVFQNYVLEEIDNFVTAWKKANPSGTEQPNKTPSSGTSGMPEINGHQQ